MTDFLLKNDKSFLRVNFTNVGLSKVLTEESIDDGTPDKKTVSSLSSILGGVKIKPEEPPMFTSVRDLFGIEYVGYIIEKQRFSKANKKWIKVDELKILGSETSKFIDPRVAYGHLYRYRIKSILKATFKISKKSLENLEALEDLQKSANEKATQETKNKLSALSTLERVKNKGLSSKSSLGEAPQTIKLSDNTKASILPGKISIEPTTEETEDLQEQINEALLEAEEVDVSYASIYYESEWSKHWQYVSTTEKTPPPPPSNIFIRPNSVKQEIFVTWLKPANPQRDIKEFKLYRRNRLGESWQSLGVFKQDENLYIDRDVEFGEKYIYALVSVDYHDFESFLSTQIQAELNDRYSLSREELPLRWISGPGVKPSEKNVILKKFREKPKDIIAKRNIRLSPGPYLGDAEKNLILKITSLDTNVSHEILLNLRNLNVTSKNKNGEE